MRSTSGNPSLLWRSAAWSACFVLGRLLFLHFFPESAHSPEEALRGAAASELALALRGEGLRLPLWCLQADHYLGGSLVTAALTALHYQLLGLRLIALKASALLFAWGALLIFYRWLHEEAGERAADAFALLYCFASPGFISLGLLAMGYHTESVFFLAWMLASASAAERRPEAWQARFSFGLASGLAFWFSGINALGAAAALAAWPVLRPARLSRLAPLAAGLLLGLVPWLLHGIFQGFPALAYLVGSFRSEPLPGVPGFGAKVWLLVARDIPLSFGLGEAGGLAYLALLTGPILLAARALPPAFRRFLLLYALLFVLAYGAGRHFIGAGSWWEAARYRYLHQLTCIAYLGVALAIAGWRWRAALLVALVGFSVYGVSRLERISPPGRVWSYRPDSYADLATHAMRTCLAGPGRLPELLRWMRASPPGRSSQAELALWTAYDYAPLAAQAEEESWPLASGPFSLGLGAYFGREVAGAENVLRVGELFQGREAELYWRGVAEGAGVSVLVEPELEERMPAGWRRAYLSFRHSLRRCLEGRAIEPEREEWRARGQGMAVAECGATEPRRAAMAGALAEGQGEGFRSGLAWGLGWQLRHRYLHDPLLVSDKIAYLPAWAWSGAIEGARAFEREHSLPASEF